MSKKEVKVEVLLEIMKSKIGALMYENAILEARLKEYENQEDPSK